MSTKLFLAKSSEVSMGGIGLKKISLAVQREYNFPVGHTELARNAVVPVLSEVDATVLNDTNADNNRTW